MSQTRPRTGARSQQHPTAPAEPPRFTPAQYLPILKVRWHAALVAGGVALALGSLVAAWLPRAYIAEAQVMVGYDLSNPLNGRELPLEQVSNYLATQIELMRRPDLMNAVAHRLQLAQVPEFTHGFVPSRGNVDEWVVGQLTKKVAVLPGSGGSQFIDVDVTARDPRVAADIANSVIDVFDQENREREAAGPRRSGVESQARLRELSRRVTEAHQHLDAFDRAHGGEAQKGAEALELSKLAEIQRRWLEARAALGKAQVGENNDDDPTAVPPLQADLEQARALLAAKQAKVDELSRTYGDAYPALRAARAEVAEQAGEVAKVQQRLSSQVGSKVAGNAGMERSLYADLQRQRQRVLEVKSVQQQAAGLWLELEAAERAYRDEMGATFKQQSYDNGHRSNMQIVSRASVPQVARSPKIIVLVGAVMAFSLLCGLAAPLVLEFRNRKVRSVADYEEGLGVRVIATLERVDLATTRPSLK